MKYKVLLFDADDTLFDFRKAERHAFIRTMEDYGYDFEEEVHLKSYHEINTAIWKEFEKGEITQKKLKVERFRRYRDALNLEFGPEDFAGKYMKHLSHASFLYPDSEELLEKLDGKYKMAIITNGLTDVQTRRIRKSSVSHYFEEIVISEEIQVSKPDPEIFIYTLNKLGHEELDSVLMIGDSLSSDIRGGSAFGVDTLWYNPWKKENTSEIKPTYEVASLMEILDHL
ncbi:YjjG family noncanonical pyrimidine nucleotidase [Proteiniclasticum sp. C24MP]|uniref:YjjG family noncanonical pyrimidine nucleotidase n=1 Tax=Proteiniclasticum sp. C24MP TaxID=3374101 RepID=UPI003754F48A